ncbi:hypothetical protein HHL19_22740 [Streptomyces sp. R302]|uniref:hypothetical protein n=1 Tax=unclassified Streptomyces TaxID=2593676 RepID=UPI00145F3B5A|nr:MULTISPECIES: hypothetical protein [unclassified Streptomyces]NML51769.1 hypothetical protein [Streptomyces sp. R301]NML81389.1 hypothetical protein [Streptomyces sp. R302]
MMPPGATASLLSAILPQPPGVWRIGGDLPFAMLPGGAPPTPSSWRYCPCTPGSYGFPPLVMGVTVFPDGTGEPRAVLLAALTVAAYVLLHGVWRQTSVLIDMAAGTAVGATTGLWAFAPAAGSGFGTWRFGLVAALPLPGFGRTTPTEITGQTVLDSETPGRTPAPERDAPRVARADAVVSLTGGPQPLRHRRRRSAPDRPRPAECRASRYALLPRRSRRGRARSRATAERVVRLGRGRGSAAC